MITKIGPESVRLLQLIAGVMITGVVVVSSLLLFVRSDSEGGLFAADPWAIGAQELVALVVAISAVSLATLLPRLVARQTFRGASVEGVEQARAHGVELAWAAFWTASVIRLALIEGAAILALILFFLQGTAIPLLVVAVLTALLVVTIPTRDRAERWIADLQARTRLDH